MKVYLLVAVAVFLVLIPTVHASLSEWNVDISVNDDGSNDWNVTLTYNETVTQSDYFVLSQISDLQVYADNVPITCQVSEEIGSSIVCRNIAANVVEYKFHTKKFVENLQKLLIFRYPFAMTELVDKFHVNLALPQGTAIVEESKLGTTGLRPFEPDYGREGSDGRRIFISWTVDKPHLGETINIYAIYENIGFDPFTTFAIILALIVIAFISILYYITKKRKIQDILPVLNDSERRVMEILLREKGEVDQRVIVKDTDFSKAKVSRIINELMARGLLEKLSKGRKNLIKLKKEVKRPENKTEQNKDQKAENKPREG